MPTTAEPAAMFVVQAISHTVQALSAFQATAESLNAPAAAAPTAVEPAVYQQTLIPPATVEAVDMSAVQAMSLMERVSSANRAHAKQQPVIPVIAQIIMVHVHSVI